MPTIFYANLKFRIDAIKTVYKFLYEPVIIELGIRFLIYHPFSYKE